MQEFHAATTLKPLYDRVRSDSTADGKLAMYMILRECATIEENGHRSSRLGSLRHRADKLRSVISDSDSDKNARLKAADALIQRCEGLGTLSIDAEQLSALLTDSASLGNQDARVRILSAQLNSGRSPGQLPTLTDSQRQVLQQAVESGDPDAIRDGGLVLSNSFANTIVELASTHQALQPIAAIQAWRLLACEYGDDCGSSNPQLLLQCAFDGQCRAGDIEDWLYYYESSPYRSQLMDQYRQSFRSAAHGDWSALEFVRGSGGTSGEFTVSVP